MFQKSPQKNETSIKKFIYEYCIKHLFAAQGHTNGMQEYERESYRIRF